MVDIVKSLKVISGQIFFLNLMVVLIFLSNLGTEEVEIVNKSIVVSKDENYSKPTLYCSNDRIWYFKETYTIVFDDKNKPKKCDQPNTIWVYDTNYINNYRLYQ